MSLRKLLRNPSEKSNESVNGHGAGCGEADVEYFWACDLTADKRTVDWSTPVDGLEDDDEDYIQHSLDIKSVCLGSGAVKDEENIVVMDSMGFNGERVKGTIANLTKGINTMGKLSLQVNGKSGATFTLTEGSGPVTLVGRLRLDYPADDDLEMSQTSQTEESKLEETEEGEDSAEDEEADDDEDEDYDEEEMEEEEEKTKTKATKRKAPVKGNAKQKQKVKIAVEDADDDDDEESSEEEEESDTDVKFQVGKKDKAKKEVKTNGKAAKKPVKDVKKMAKKVKK